LNKILLTQILNQLLLVLLLLLILYFLQMRWLLPTIYRLILSTPTVSLHIYKSLKSRNRYFKTCIYGENSSLTTRYPPSFQ